MLFKSICILALPTELCGIYVFTNIDEKGIKSVARNMIAATRTKKNESRKPCMVISRDKVSCVHIGKCDLRNFQCKCCRVWSMTVIVKTNEASGSHGVNIATQIMSAITA